MRLAATRAPSGATTASSASSATSVAEIASAAAPPAPVFGGAAACVADCGSDACREACITKVSDASAAKTVALFQCLTGYSCTDQTCLEAYCDGPRRVCASDDGTALLDCPAMFACTTYCDTSDPQECVNACASASTSEAAAGYNDVVTCAQTAGCTMLSCVQTECPTEYAACFGAQGG